eukprot:CAMPEP_0113891890 /NCGR_PEP_ID=MMETSP0780_2-20120614/15053_1 /TAXON_ID=652834 /ORGANISM="Palpitomonas bilix" /LENGTH=54 /DNA_ID=CAMNT_0000881649 /DNA_START=64 /DNA_END=225 /DNA_ORIENTATION=- /assembly_acc=CAM_ASM_000599
MAKQKSGTRHSDCKGYGRARLLAFGPLLLSARVANIGNSVPGMQQKENKMINIS